MFSGSRPAHVGIKAMEFYIPNRYISQSELEHHDNVSPGKYEIGLGQIKMGFCDDREDIYSFCLTAVSQLMTKNAVSPVSIGRLEVGTETLLDKSKSVKSVLMQLFAPFGNTDIEGVDTLNACYGGTNALFNAINWIESSSWDGRDAIVVAGDIAIYEKGAARPTGGAGAVAMLVGPNAPLAVEPGRRGSYMQHTYDFYKPKMSSEYPVVDGQYSIECYFQAVDACYKAYNIRATRIKERCGTSGRHQDRIHLNGGINGSPLEKIVNGSHTQEGPPYINGHSSSDTARANGFEPQSPYISNGTSNLSNSTSREECTELERFDYVCFHTPNCKLAQKSYARLLYNDFVSDPTKRQFENVPRNILEVAPEDSYRDKSIEKAFMPLSAELYKQRSLPSTLAASLCGNMYTASLYGALASLISNVGETDLIGKRIAMFSYGSGLASSLFSFRVEGDVQHIRRGLDLQARLKARHHKSPLDYEKAMSLRENAYSKPSFTPSGDVEELLSGTYYLSHVDEMFRRFYHIKA